MAFNSKKVLEDNIDAIRVAFDIIKNKRTATEQEIATLSRYRGFGGIKAVLYDINKENKDNWSNLDLSLLPLLQELHSLLKTEAGSEQNYKRYLSSIQDSTLSAFYTPDEVTDTISKLILETNVDIKTVLEPSAGSGKFVDSIHKYGNNIDVTAFEKDLLTGLILKASHRSDKVHISPFEDISMTNKGTYNLVISNIPFGNFAVFDSHIANAKNKKKAHSARAIHSYFFSKAVDMASDNGIIAFIVTSSFLDNEANCPTRQYLMEECDLVSAVRLPNNLFTDIANTEVGSDLIILQKNPNKKGLSPEEKAFQSHYVWKGKTSAINYNGLFARKGAKVVYTSANNQKNQYGKHYIDIRHTGGVTGIANDLGKLLAPDLVQLKKIFHRIETSEELFQELGTLFSSATPEVVEKNIDLELSEIEHLLVGALITQNDKIYKLSSIDKYAETAVAEYYKTDATAKNILTKYIPVRDSYLKLYKTEGDTQEEQVELRKNLNKAYDAFVSEFGNLRKKQNAGIITLDKLNNDVLALEVPSEGKFIKADIFEKPVNIRILKEEMTINEAYMASLNEFGDFNKAFVLDRTKLSWEQIREELKGRIFYNIETQEFSASEKVICGDVYSKIRDAENILAKEPNNKDIQELIATLEEVKPIPVSFDVIGFNLGERWIPTSLYAEFAKELFHVDDISIMFHRSSDSYKVVGKENNEYTREEFSVQGSMRHYDGYKLLSYALNDTTPEISKRIYNENNEPITVPDHEKISEASMKIEGLRNSFEQWMMKRSQREKELIQERYNEMFNCYVKPEYDGSHLTLSDIDFKALGFPSLYQSQKDAIWMQLMNGGGIVDHEVGLGKTLTMCVAAYEAKRIGLVNKPLIAGMKANVEDIAKQFKQAYPHAKLLYVDKFEKKHRKAILEQIKNNDWDCVIISHDNLAKIPCDPDITREIMTRELAELEDTILSVERAESKNILSQLRKQKQNLKAKLEELENKKKELQEEGIPTFGEMGIDHIHIDESHIFKNLGFQTKHKRVAGLGNSEGSNRARFLQYHIASIQKKRNRDLCATFYSGTTISNSLTELYLIFKYLVPRKLEEQNIFSFDSWAAVYTKKSKEPEYSITNELTIKERFRYFVKVPELASFYNQICDYRTGEDIKLDRPEMKEILVDIEPTPDQKRYTEVLKDFASSGNFALINRVDPHKKQDGRMLIATNESKKMAMDMRLIDPTLPDDPNNKISKCCEILYKHYVESTPVSGTQLVFCDMGTPNTKSEFVLYHEIKRKLVEEYNIPTDKVQFIHSFDTDKRKDKIKKAVNDGEVRILIGSTSKMGTGLNVQSRIVAMHHLDIPWKPSELEQRNGRGKRKGNWVAKEHFGNEVKSYVYAVKQSLDNYKFSLLKNKQTFITQIKLGQKGSRVIDEGAMDENSGLNFAEYVAVLSGNTDLLDKAKLDKKIALLEKDYYSFNEKKALLLYKEDRYINELTNKKELFSKLEKDLETFSVPINYEMSESKIETYPMSINGFKFDQTKIKPEEKDNAGLLNVSYFTQLGKYINKELVPRLEKRPGEDLKIGEICGAPIILRKEINAEDNSLLADVDLTSIICQIKSPTGITYTHNNGKYPVSDSPAGHYFSNAVSKIPGLYHDAKNSILNLEKQLLEVADIKQKEWPRIEELQKLKKEAAVIAQRIELSIKKKHEDKSINNDNSEIKENKSKDNNQNLRPRF